MNINNKISYNQLFLFLIFEFLINFAVKILFDGK